MKKIPVLLLCYMHIAVFTHAQEVRGGLMPEAGFTLPIYGRFTQTYKIENQHYLLTNKMPGKAFQYEYERTDLQFFVNYKLNALWRLTIGYQLRIEEQWNTHHRPIQQVSVNQRIAWFRLNHRIRSDQTFERNIPSQFRLRYRVALEVPLNGTRIDPGEFYLTISDEPIYGFQANRHDIENRFVLTLGHFFNNGNKLEVSIDHRSDRFVSMAVRQRIWFKIGWFVNITDS